MTTAQTTTAGAAKKARAGIQGRVIDADGHVYEPDVLWSEYVEPAFRDQLPAAIMAKNIGVDVDPEVIAAARAVEQAQAQSGRVGTDTWDEASRSKILTSGGWDPVQRLVDMDDEGIDEAVLYPTRMLMWIEDLDLYEAACRGYNNWLRDYCAADPGRLHGVAIVPLQDADAAITEARRAIDELGFKAVMIRPAPYMGIRKLYDPAYDTFWQALVDLGVPLGVHPLPFADMPNVTRGLFLDEGMITGTQGLFLRQGLSNALDVMVALAWFIGGGICERFPDLEVAFLEGSGGWIVTMLERLDHHFEIFGSEHQSTRPSELFARQCMISFDPDEVALAFTVEQLGAEKIIWASDYPHPDAKIPGVVDELFAAVAPLSKSDQELIVGQTAADLYHL
jgi:predicted TIM-barrel fold metal-dependent hydrolase